MVIFRPGTEKREYGWKFWYNFYHFENSSGPPLCWPIVHWYCGAYFFATLLPIPTKPMHCYLPLTIVSLTKQNNNHFLKHSLFQSHRIQILTVLWTQSVQKPLPALVTSASTPAWDHPVEIRLSVWLSTISQDATVSKIMLGIRTQAANANKVSSFAKHMKIGVHPVLMEFWILPSSVPVGKFSAISIANWD